LRRQFPRPFAGLPRNQAFLRSLRPRGNRT